MSEENFSGGMKEVGGKVEETVGRVTGNNSMQADGLAKQIEGKAEKLYGQANDTVSNAADATKTEVSSLVNSGRHTIQTHPYGAVIATFVLGLIFGGMQNGGR